MALSLSNLLNPAPASGSSSLKLDDHPMEDIPGTSTSASRECSASRSFQPSDAQSSNGPSQRHMEPPADIVKEEDNEDAVALRKIKQEPIEPKSETPDEIDRRLLESTVPLDSHETSADAAEPPSTMDGIHDESITEDREPQPLLDLGDQHRSSADAVMEHSQNEAETPVSTQTSLATGIRPRSAIKSSTKNEGQHTDKRYLCYICNKLFTRRRSVRDHISKIHNTKTWEPNRSLEIIVDPATSEPVEPLEKQIRQGFAQGSPAPPNAVAALKTEPSIDGSRASSVEAFATPAPIIGKKRPAPSSSHSIAATKKGMARVKSTATPSKRLKTTDSDSIVGTAIFRSPSATPASVRRTTAPKSKQQSSASVASSPAPSDSRTSVGPDENEDEADSPNSNDDGEVFCICRKGDNHTWMIACDGGCEEWFHGKCVNIRERDGDLIDKYICPNCQREGFQTTWKRMCRRKSCRKPARVLDNPPSKYCSPECGRMFFVELVQRSDPHAVSSSNGQYIVEGARQKKYIKKRKPGRDEDDRAKRRGSPYSHHMAQVNGIGGRQFSPASEAKSEDEGKSEYETDSSADEEILPNRGGALRAGEVKAIIDKCKTVEEWHELGKKPTSAPTDHDGSSNVSFAEVEMRKLANITDQMVRYRERNSILNAREVFLGIIRARSTNIVDELRKANPKLKDLCGFDPRLSWTEEEFLHWRNSAEGAAVLESQQIGPPEPKEKNGFESTDDEREVHPRKGGVCIKSRCQRHGKWQRIQLAELRFEQEIVRRQVQRLEKEEAAITDWTILKAWEQSKA